MHLYTPEEKSQVFVVLSWKKLGDKHEIYNLTRLLTMDKSHGHLPDIDYCARTLSAFSVPLFHSLQNGYSVLQVSRRAAGSFLLSCLVR